MIRHRMLWPVCLFLTSTAWGQLPNPALDFIFPAGGQVGSALSVEIAGRDLDDAHQLVFSHPGITGRQMTREPNEFEQGPQPVPNRFTVSIPLNIPPGSYDVRAVGRFGASTPLSFRVGLNAELQEVGQPHAPEQAQTLPLDAVVNGRVETGAIDYYRFHALQGQTCVIECLAQRIGAPLAPAITIWNQQGRQLARSRQLIDPVLQFTAPEEGDYLLGIHDHVYGGGPEYLYRLQVHAGPYLVAARPLAAQSGSQANVTVYGWNLPQATAAEPVRLGGQVLQSATVPLFAPAGPVGMQATSLVRPVVAAAHGFAFQWPTPRGLSNQLNICYAQHPVVSEQEHNDTPADAQRVSVPCDFSGQFYPRRDQDWIQFSVHAGQSYEVQIYSHRLGLPTDVEMVVERLEADSANAKQVSAEDDTRSDGQRFRQTIRRALELTHRDPVARFQADQAGEYRIGLRDLNGGSIDDPRFAYRLVIAPQRPDFELLAWNQHQATDDDKKIDRAAMVLRRGGTLPVMIDLLPQGGFHHEVRITAKGLPAGVSASTCRLAPGQTAGILMLAASTDAAAWNGPIEIVGETQIGETVLRRAAREAILTGSTPNVEQVRPAAKLARQLCLSVLDDDVAPVRLDVVSQNTEHPDQWAACLGSELALPWQFTKQQEIQGDIEFVPIGLPDKVAAAPVKLTAESTNGELTLDFSNAEIQPGIYTVFLRGKVKSVYARNPQRIVAAEARRAAFDETIQSLDQQVAKANESLASARQEVALCDAGVLRLAKVQQVVSQSVTTAVKQVQQIDDQLASLQQAESDSTDTSGSLQQLVQDIRSATTDACARLQAAETSVKQIEHQLALAREQQQTAKSKVAAAEATHAQLIEKRIRADAFRNRLEEQIAAAKKESGPSEITSYVDSPAFTIDLAKSPVTVGIVPSDKLQLERSETREIEVVVQRNFGFLDAIRVSLESPDSVNGISARRRRIERHQDRVTLQVSAAADATPGQHTVYALLSFRFNGVALQDRVPIQITVIE